MANRNTYVSTHTLVKAKRIRKVMNAILTNPQMNPADLKFLEDKLRREIDKQSELDKLGDNHTIEFYNDVSKFKELEVKYLTSAKEALKGL